MQLVRQFLQGSSPGIKGFLYVLNKFYLMTTTIINFFKKPMILVILSIGLFSCEKESGEGGKSSVYGKVYVKDYNAEFTVLKEEYYGPNIWVYIIYGDNKDYSDRIRTNYEGTYEFKYLRPGSYTIYTYSKDSTLQTLAEVAVIQQVDIPKKKQEIELPDLIIFN
jgi:hypothetical protein